MFRVFGYPLLFLAMFSIAGGHWAVLQSVAWTGMVIQYSKTSTIGVALEKTFSGKNPCELCHVVKEGREKESRLPAALKADKKIDKFVAHAASSAPAPFESPFSYPPDSDETACVRPSAPPAHIPIAA